MVMPIFIGRTRHNHVLFLKMLFVMARFMLIILVFAKIGFPALI